MNRYNLRNLIEDPYQELSTKDSQHLDYERRTTRVRFTEGYTREELLHKVNSITSRKN